MKRLSSLFFVLFLIPTLFIFAQEGNATPTIEITGADANDFPTLTITTNVLDRNGLPVEGLDVDNFTLGGDLQEIAQIVRVENITRDALPFATVLVIDNSTSMSGLPIQRAKEAAALFVESVTENDPIAIVTFNSQAQLIQDFTTDKEQLLNVIDTIGVSGQTALYDAAVLGIDVAANAPVSRRSVILLSDGAEYGERSNALREDGLDRAQQNGVSVFAIGLGFGIDRSYLINLSGGSNARFYEEPNPDELTTIYGDLATLFRSQYVITLDSDMAGDGTLYDFDLQAATEQGTTNTDQGTIRAPIPVPIVRYDDNLLTVPFSSPVEITPTILADDEISQIDVTVNGDPVETDNGVFILDPQQYPPATYTIAATVTDSDGDSGSDSAEFQTSALASNVAFNLDIPDGGIRDVTTVTLATDGQTPATSATYTLSHSDESVRFDPITDAEANFPLTLDPFDYPADEYLLGVGVENEGGATANASVPLSIAAIPPRDLQVLGLPDGNLIDEATPLVVTANTQAGAELSETVLTVNGQVLDNFTLDPIAFAEGSATLEATVTDSQGLSSRASFPIEIASVPSQITFGDFPDPVTADTTIPVQIIGQSPLSSVSYDLGDGAITLDPNSDGNYTVPLPIAELGDGDHLLTVTANTQAGRSDSAEVRFTVTIPATATPIVDQTGTVNAQMALDTEGTAQAVATSDAIGTVDALATSNVIAEINAQATSDAQATLDISATDNANAQATSDAQATQAGQATADANTQATTDANAQATNDYISTVDANLQATIDAQATRDIDATVNANTQATAEAQVIADINATNDAQATRNVQNTADAHIQATTDANAQATRNALATNEALATSDANAIATVNTQATADANAQATRDAQATVDTEANAQATTDAQATVDTEANAQATTDANVTLEAQALVAINATNDAQATVNTQMTVRVETQTAPTATASATAVSTSPTATRVPSQTPVEPTAIVTLTPVELVEVEAENSPVIGNLTGWMVCGGLLLLAFILLSILFFGRRRDDNRR